jgi:hypothetical protein
LAGPEVGDQCFGSRVSARAWNRSAERAAERRRGARRGVLVSRHLMEPDPEAALPSLGFLLWGCVFVLGVVVTLLRLAT